MSDYPADLTYSKDHEWVKVSGNRATVGITKFAVEQLGDVMTVSFDVKVGDTVAAGKAFGTIESVKALSDLYTPLSGQVVTVNGDRPYKGLASYYDIGDARKAAWSYRAPFEAMARIGDLVSFEPDKVEVAIDGKKLEPVPGQTVVEHGPDRNLSVDEVGRIQLGEDQGPARVRR
jgi:hypothetical protein